VEGSFCRRLDAGCIFRQRCNGIHPAYGTDGRRTLSGEGFLDGSAPEARRHRKGQLFSLRLVFHGVPLFLVVRPGKEKGSKHLLLNKKEGGA